MGRFGLFDVFDFLCVGRTYLRLFAFSCAPLTPRREAVPLHACVDNLTGVLKRLWAGRVGYIRRFQFSNLNKLVGVFGSPLFRL